MEPYFSYSCCSIYLNWYWVGNTSGPAVGSAAKDVQLSSLRNFRGSALLRINSGGVAWAEQGRGSLLHDKGPPLEPWRLHIVRTSVVTSMARYLKIGMVPQNDAGTYSFCVLDYAAKRSRQGSSLKSLLDGRG